MAIIVVEDDVMVQEELVHLLKRAGYQATAITDFNTDVASQLIQASPDLVLLDINLPNQTGFDICRTLKTKTNIAVLVLTSRNQLSDELHALDLGADDYMTKPFPKEKLLARLKNLLRRYETTPNLLDGGGFQLDPNSYTMYVARKSQVLPPNEGRMLALLLKTQNQVITKDQLSRELWGTADFIDENALQVNVTRLRKTLRQWGLADRLETVRGQGYRWIEREVE